MMSNWDSEIAQIHDEMEAEEGIIEQGAKMLEQVVDENKSYHIARVIFYDGTSDIAFTSIEKKEYVEQVEKWMDSQSRKF